MFCVCVWSLFPTFDWLAFGFEPLHSQYTEAFPPVQNGRHLSERMVCVCVHVILSMRENCYRNLVMLKLAIGEETVEMKCWVVFEMQEWTGVCQGCWTSRSSIYQQSIQKLKNLSMKTDTSLWIDWGLGTSFGMYRSVLTHCLKTNELLPNSCIICWMKSGITRILRENFRKNHSLFQRSLVVMKHVFVGATKKHCDQLFQWTGLSQDSANIMVLSMLLMCSELLHRPM